MKNLIAVFLISMLAFASVNTEAKRMGGGKSVGQQSSNVTKKQAPAPAVAPAAATAPTAAPARPWGAMLGGLATGLGLAWLASSLGLGAAFGNILMAILIGVAVLAAVGWFMRRRINSNENLAYQGANPASLPGRFSSANVSGGYHNQPAWSIPQGFDVAGFETTAQRNFVVLQDAWDRADTTTLGTMMTDAMLEEMNQQLSQRDSTVAHRTAVMSVTARLLGIEETDTAWTASVEFTGLLQEAIGEAATEFEEVWNMTKSKSNGGWVLAGIQTYNQ